MNRRINHRKNIIDGFVSIFESVGNAPSYTGMRVPMRGFDQDAKNISNDFRSIANDMRKATERVKHQYGTH